MRTFLLVSVVFAQALCTAGVAFFFTVVQGDYLFRLQTVAQATDQSCTSDQARMLDLMKSVSLDKMEKVDQFFEKLLSQTGFTDVREMVDHLMSDELVRALFFVA